MEIVLFLLQLFTVTFGKQIFCYYSSFAQTRKGVGKFLPENINPHLCTHLIYAFVDITSDGRGLRPFNKNDLGKNGLYARTLALKKSNPALKILLAVGGWQIGSKPFIPMIKDENTRATWIKNVVKYLRKRGFDGLDMDWEFPATRGSQPGDKYKFTALLKGLYEAFKKESQETGREKLLLTLATASGTYYIDQSYEPYKIINYIDFMLLMTYNYHGQWEKKTGHHSGLYPHKDDPKHGEKSQLYQEWSIDYWLSIGIPKNKLVVGIPSYGMTFTLADESKHSVNALAIGGGEMGQYTKETGILSYYEVCINLRDRGWKKEWIDDQMVPYAYSGDQWVGYEDRRSVAFKAANIIKRDLAGAFVWSVEMDDFGGVCGQGHYPLLTTLVDALGHGPVSQTAARERVTPVQTSVSYSEDGHHRMITTPVPGEDSGNSPSSIGYFSPATGGSTASTEEKSLEAILNYSIIRKHKEGPQRKPAFTTRRQHRVEIPEYDSTTTVRRTEIPHTLPRAKSSEFPVLIPSEGTRSHQLSTMKTPQKPKTVIKLETPRLGSSSILKHKTKDLSLSIPHWIKPAAATESAVSSTAKPVVMETMTSKYGSRGGQINMWWARPYPMEESKIRTNSASSVELRGQTTKGLWWRQRAEQHEKKVLESPTQAKSKSEVKVKALELPSKDGYYVVSSWNNINNYNGGADDSKRWWAAGVPRQQHIKSVWPQQRGSWTRVKLTTADPELTRTDALKSSSRSLLMRQEVCRNRGIGTFADPMSCDHFIMCLPGNWMDFPPPVMACPAGTRFDTRLKVCNYASDVTCLQ